MLRVLWSVLTGEPREWRREPCEPRDAALILDEARFDSGDPSVRLEDLGDEIQLSGV